MKTMKRCLHAVVLALVIACVLGLALRVFFPIQTLSNSAGWLLVWTPVLIVAWIIDGPKRRRE